MLYKFKVPFDTQTVLLYTSYRHIYGDSAKGKGQYSDVKNALTSGESQYIKANGKFWAHGRATGGAPIFITKISDVGRQKAGQKYISTHKGRLTDFDFHPFIETLIATGSDDTKVNISKFPSEGLTENITTPEISIAGHKKKISLIRFHPSANNVIASASYDRTVKIWNIENAACLGTMSECKDNIYSMDWNKDGSMLAVTGKDKVLRVYDPRQQDSAIKIEGAFGGIKSRYTMSPYQFILCFACFHIMFPFISLFAVHCSQLLLSIENIQ